MMYLPNLLIEFSVPDQDFEISTFVYGMILNITYKRYPTSPTHSIPSMWRYQMTESNTNGIFLVYSFSHRNGGLSMYVGLECKEQAWEETKQRE